MKSKFLILLVPMFFAACAQTPIAAERCPAGVLRCEAVWTGRRLVYAKGQPRTPGRNMQFGAESEYTPETAMALLAIYVPDSTITKVSAKKWGAMSHEDRLAVIEKNREALFPYREPGKMYLSTTDERLKSILPKAMVNDGHNFEIVTRPTDSLDELLSDLRYIEQTLGGGSLQLTFSTPKEDLPTAQARDLYFREQLGHLDFVNELDTMEKLDAGYQKYRSDPNSWAAASFNHPYLGPMVRRRQLKLEDWIHRVADGKNLSEDDIANLSYIIDSSKFIGGVSYRPDVAQSQNRVAFEIRICHKSLQCIERIARREVSYMENGYDDFVGFADAEAFDPVASFGKMPRDLQNLLKTLFPRTRDLQMPEVELYRNFSYPLRDWSWFTKLKPGLPKSVAAAQKNYIATLSSISQQYAQYKISRDQAITQVMGALAGFPRESGLVQAMEDVSANYDQRHRNPSESPE